MKTEGNLRKALEDHYPYIYGSILQVISDEFDRSAKCDFHTIFKGIRLAFMFIYDGSNFRFYGDWITQEEELIARACRLRMINRMRDLFMKVPSKKQHIKRDFLDDLFFHFLQQDAMDTFFDIFKVSGEKSLELFHFDRITKKCPPRIVSKAMGYLPDDCSPESIFFCSLQSPYADVVQLVLRRVGDRKAMQNLLTFRVVPALRVLQEATDDDGSAAYGKFKNQLKYDGVFYNIKHHPNTIIEIIQKELK